MMKTMRAQVTVAAEKLGI